MIVKIMSALGILLSANSYSHVAPVDQYGGHQEGASYHCHRSECGTAYMNTQKSVTHTYRGIQTSAMGQGKTNKMWLGGWQSDNHQCSNPRHLFLKKTSESNTTYLSSNECRVKTGRWLDFSTGEVYHRPGQVVISHIIPLSYAKENAVDNWSKEIEKKFLNDEDNMIVLGAKTNILRLNQSISDWQPRNNLCKYSAAWESLSDRYNIILKDADHDALRSIYLMKCADKY